MVAHDSGLYNTSSPVLYRTAAAPVCKGMFLETRFSPCPHPLWLPMTRGRTISPSGSRVLCRMICTSVSRVVSRNISSASLSAPVVAHDSGSYHILYQTAAAPACKGLFYRNIFLSPSSPVVHDSGSYVRDISCACEQQQGTILSMFAVCNVDDIVDISSSDRIAKEHFRFLEHRF